MIYQFLQRQRQERFCSGCGRLNGVDVLLKLILAFDLQTDQISVAEFDLVMNEPLRDILIPHNKYNFAHSRERAVPGMAEAVPS